MNDPTELPPTSIVPVIFPIGFHGIHPDTSMNLQMTRWFGRVGEPDMKEEMRMTTARIAQSPATRPSGQSRELDCGPSRGGKSDRAVGCSTRNARDRHKLGV